MVALPLNCMMSDASAAAKVVLRACALGDWIAPAAR
jgi:hypothetical protein